MGEGGSLTVFGSFTVESLRADASNFAYLQKF